MQNILVVVDMQNDFIDGALGTAEAAAIVDRVAEKIRTFEGKIFYTRDTHEENYPETREGRSLPVKHCIRGTDGWQIRPELCREAGGAEIVDKPTFGSRKLAERLEALDHEEKIGTVTLVGLCTDICVISNAMAIRAFLPEAEIVVDASCCAGVTPESHERALLAMKACQVIVTGEREKSAAEELVEFIEKSPSPFHVIQNLREMYLAAGYDELDERERWEVRRGGRYFTVRNGSSAIAFAVPEKEAKGFHMAASHSDSPTFKIKEKPDMTVEERYVKLNTEKYGGMILSTWMDRPLSAAGRVTFLENGQVACRLVDMDSDLLVIPSLAIHMSRDAKSAEYNPQVDMLPLYACGNKKDFMQAVARAAGVKEEDLLSSDLFLYVREKGRILGAERELILSPKLDDLQCAYTSARAMANSAPDEYINVCAVLDNEEVGSGTKQGADSTFLEDVLRRIAESLGMSGSDYRQRIAASFMISADNAHAVHPNHTEKADPTNRPYINGGIVIKFHGSQRYATDAFSAGVLKNICRQAGVPCQTYANRSDIAGGSTLGNISTAHVSVPTVDIGLPQLAMHSAVETAGVKDTAYAIKMFETFYGGQAR